MDKNFPGLFLVGVWQQGAAGNTSHWRNLKRASLWQKLVHTTYLLLWWHPQRPQGKPAQGGMQDFLLNNTILLYYGENLGETNKTVICLKLLYPTPFLHFCCYPIAYAVIIENINSYIKKVCIAFLHFINIVDINLVFNHIQIKASLCI